MELICSWFGADDRNTSSGEIWLQFLLDGGFVDTLALV